MAAHVVELEVQSELAGAFHLRREVLTKPSGVTSVEARPPGVSLESTINHEGPS
jgi:hypothetical protein